MIEAASSVEPEVDYWHFNLMTMSVLDEDYLKKKRVVFT
jgi:hypothetical protein